MEYFVNYSSIFGNKTINAIVSLRRLTSVVLSSWVCKEIDYRRQVLRYAGEPPA